MVAMDKRLLKACRTIEDMNIMIIVSSLYKW